MAGTQTVGTGAVLKSLTEQYSCRARDFADTVALLGSHHSVGPEVIKLVAEIREKRVLCNDAEAELSRYLELVDAGGSLLRKTL